MSNENTLPTILSAEAVLELEYSVRQTQLKQAAKIEMAKRCPSYHAMVTSIFINAGLDPHERYYVSPWQDFLLKDRMVRLRFECIPSRFGTERDYDDHSDWFVLSYCEADLTEPVRLFMFDEAHLTDGDGNIIPYAAVVARAGTLIEEVHKGLQGVSFAGFMQPLEEAAANLSVPIVTTA